MFKLVKKPKNPPITLKNHFDRRNKVLIKRRAGGFGDILMQRMMFKDLKAIGLDITYACPYQFIDMAKNQPFVECIDLSLVRDEQYGAIYDISTACRVQETKLAPHCLDHRSDIWANYCGVNLTSHEMFLSPIKDNVELCKKELDKINPENKPIVILATKSTNCDFGIAKSLLDKQVVEIVNYIRELNFLPISLHSEPQDIYTSLGVTQLSSLQIQHWIAVVSLADYVISVDTATFHMAGGLKKPLVGIFAFTDGKVYGKYFDFILVQKHRDNGWDCGPCFQCYLCPKEQNSEQKPCLTELTFDEIKQGLDLALKKWPVK